MFRGSRILARLRALTWLLAGVWSGCIAGSLLWNLHQLAHRSLEVAHLTALDTIENDLLYRRWASKQGGVYVRVSAHTPPNPYLEVPYRDVATTSGLALTLVNPAYMARQVNALADETKGSRGHLTSLNPIRPGNAPDPWEAAALRSFEQGATEVSSFESLPDGERLRLMRPFVTEPSCLECHAPQGYRVGDIRGGVSVSVPMAPLRAIQQTMANRLAGAHAGLWMIGLVGIGVSRWSLGKGILARERASADLQREVTERRLAEQELRASEGRYRDLVQNANSSIIRWKRDGTLTFLNEHAQQFFGYSAAEAVGQHVNILVPPQESTGANLTALTQDIVAHPDRYTNNVNENICRDGRRVWMTWTNRPILDEQGQVAEILAVGSDITALKQAEDARRKTEERYHLLFSTMTEGFALHQIVTDDKGRPCDYIFLDANPAFERLTGLARADLLGKRVRQIMPDTEDYWIEAYGRVALTGEPAHLENFAAELNRWFEAFAYSTEPGQFAAVFTDITERKQAEERLRQSAADLQAANTSLIESRRAALNLMDDALAARQNAEQIKEELRQINAGLEQRVAERTAQLAAAARYARSLIEASLDPLVTISPEGKITDVNRATELVTGVPRAELVGSNFSYYFTEPQRADAGYQQVLSRGVVRDYPLTIRHVSGTTTDVLYNATLYRNEAGEVQGVFAAARDMTERKAAELERQNLRDELARISRITTGGQLAASLAHELNQPLGAIVCNVQAVNQILAQAPSDLAEVRDALKDIEADSRRAGAVIHQLRGLYQRGGQQRHPLQFNDILRKTEPLLRNECGLKGVALRLELDPALPTVSGNEIGLQQVVLNLANNALEAMASREPGARRLEIRTAHEKPNTVRVSFRDSGVGLAEDQLRRVFEPFFTTKPDGMGMGLAICYSIIEAHGGRLWAENNPDRGAMFHLSLPALPEDAHEHA